MPKFFDPISGKCIEAKNAEEAEKLFSKKKNVDPIDSRITKPAPDRKTRKLNSSPTL